MKANLLVGRLIAAGLLCSLWGCLATASTWAVSPFTWHEGDGHTDLMLDGKPILRHMHAHDTSTPERLHETYKPYTHVFDMDGADVITKGPGGEFTHHRGIFIGWNKLTHEGKVFDLWHMKSPATMIQQRFDALEATADKARMVATIHWNGDDPQKPLLVEKREIVVHRTANPNERLIDVTSSLTAVRGEVFLDGDPEHAGLQFRAHNDLSVAAKAKTGSATYTFPTEDTDPRTEKGLAWALMSYPLRGQTYHVQHMNHPNNPSNTVYSAYRDYGRFGAFFTHRIADGQTLTLRYRIRITTGEKPTREELAAQHAAFVKATR